MFFSRCPGGCRDPLITSRGILLRTISLQLIRPGCLNARLQNCRMNHIHCGASYRVVSFDTVQTVRLEQETHICLNPTTPTRIHTLWFHTICIAMWLHILLSWLLPLFARQVASVWSYVCYGTVTRYISDPVIQTMWKSCMAIFLRTLTYE